MGDVLQVLPFGQALCVKRAQVLHSVELESIVRQVCVKHVQQVHHVQGALRQPHIGTEQSVLHVSQTFSVPLGIRAMLHQVYVQLDVLPDKPVSIVQHQHKFGVERSVSRVLQIQIVEQESFAII